MSDRSATNSKNTAPPADVRGLVDALIDQAVSRRASDIHVDPSADGCRIKFRIDGLLQNIATHDVAVGRMIVTRLMVMAKLLTYRLDVPQEGSATVTTSCLPNQSIELRISIMPTTHGPRCAVRLPAELLQPQALDDLMLPAKVAAHLKAFAGADAGMLIVTGPAGSGKTTTIYALLRHIAQTCPGLSIVTLEDPVERDLNGVVQIEVSPFGQLTYERALRSILRHDPQVLMLGEIRDAATASIAIQAALSGHRLVCTLHASSPAGALVRLLEMGVEPYHLTSAIFGVLTQRLLRKLSPGCSNPSGVNLADCHPGCTREGSQVDWAHPQCRDASRSTALHDEGATDRIVPQNHADRVSDSANRAAKETTYAGRVPTAEFVRMDASLRRIILERADLDSLRSAYEIQPDFRSLRDAADDLVANRLTDIAEIVRVFGAINQGNQP